LDDFLEYEPAPLSERASAGFLKRAAVSTLNFPDGLLEDVEAHVEAMRSAVPA
jgi:hypothetical protein